MASRVSPYVDNTGLVFAYDLANTNRSYLGQPTTNNFGGSFRNFTGTSYSPDGEWVSSEPTRFTKTYYADFPTPIGPGATLIEESGTAGFHHLSRYGGGDESGAHSLSCYIHPLASGITDFCIGMLGDGSNNIQFNLDTRVITYGGGISNRNAFIRDVPGWPGWLRVGANIEGRGGGWVGCIGYSSYTSYTGTAGGKKAYITGIQYEYTSQPTSFTTGTRSVTQALKDLTGKSTINLSNVSFNSNAQMTFDGTDDFINLGTSSVFNQFTSDFTVDTWVRRLNVGPTWGNIIGDYYTNSTANALEWQIMMSNTGQLNVYNVTGGYVISPIASGFGANTWVNVVLSRVGSTLSLYANSNLIASTTNTTTFGSTTGTVHIGIDGNSSSEPFAGDISAVKIYRRGLSASENQQNFNAIKGRYGL